MGIRFAPSPTGTFHLGNLRTAWISHWWARRLGKPWILRFEDIDGPRVVPGAQECQTADMTAIGLHADQVLVQSQFHSRHTELFEAARREGRIYACNCSRKEVLQAIQGAASAPHTEPPLYSGACRAREGLPPVSGHPTLGWRFKCADPSGHQDFIIGRTDPSGGNFSPAYNWACAIDDWDGKYDLLVRAWDLEHVAIQQRAIAAWLNERSGLGIEPAVYHTALVTGDAGERLEKRTKGVTLAELNERGISPREVALLFEKSFHEDSSTFAPGRLWGEGRKSITLSELLPRA